MKIPLLYFAFIIRHCLCIIGGVSVPINNTESRFVVSLRLRNGMAHFCGGAFIASNFVLTAASCVKDKKVDSIAGLIGGTSWAHSNHRGVTVFFDKVFLREPTGQKRVRNNIALLHLYRKNFRSELDEVRTIEFSSDDTVPTNGSSCKAFGWGKSTLITDKTTDYLQEMQTHIQDAASCKSLNSDVDESNICTYSRNASLCDFDEGSPLSSSSVLWGIATEEYACSENPLFSDIFTRVDLHKDWIKKIIDGNSSMRHKPQSVTTSTWIVVILMTWLCL